MTQELWSGIDTNFTGCLNIVKAVFEDMAESNYGRVFNISSINEQKEHFG